MKSERNRSFGRREFLKAVELYGIAAVLHGSGIEGDVKWNGGIVTKIDTDLPRYALTIDDGWNTAAMKGILDLLKGKRLQSTFFLIGNAAANCEYKYPGILKRIVKEGHSIGYHTMRHEHIDEIVEKNSSWWKNDFGQWWSLMSSKLGSDLSKKGLKRYARAPYNEFTGAFMSLCRSEGLQAFSWSKHVGHLKRGDEPEKGDVVLLHVTKDDFALMRGMFNKNNGISPSSLHCFEDGYSCPAPSPQVDERLQEILKILENFESNSRFPLDSLRELQRLLKSGD